MLNLAQDKIKHIVAGAIIFLITYAVSSLIGMGYEMIAATSAVLMAAIGKEMYDYITNKLAEKKWLAPPHHVEFADIVATCAGGIAGMIMVHLIELVI
jgi:hypothetical protein